MLLTRVRKGVVPQYLSQISQLVERPGTVYYIIICTVQRTEPRTVHCIITIECTVHFIVQFTVQRHKFTEGLSVYNEVYSSFLVELDYSDRSFHKEQLGGCY